MNRQFCQPYQIRFCTRRQPRPRKCLCKLRNRPVEPEPEQEPESDVSSESSEDYSDSSGSYSSESKEDAVDANPNVNPDVPPNGKKLPPIRADLRKLELQLRRDAPTTIEVIEKRCLNSLLRNAPCVPIPARNCINNRSRPCTNKCAPRPCCPKPNPEEVSSPVNVNEAETEHRTVDKITDKELKKLLPNYEINTPEGFQVTDISIRFEKIRPELKPTSVPYQTYSEKRNEPVSVKQEPRMCKNITDEDQFTYFLGKNDVMYRTPCGKKCFNRRYEMQDLANYDGTPQEFKDAETYFPAEKKANEVKSPPEEMEELDANDVIKAEESQIVSRYEPHSATELGVPVKHSEATDLISKMKSLRDRLKCNPKSGMKKKEKATNGKKKKKRISFGSRKYSDKSRMEKKGKNRRGSKKDRNISFKNDGQTSPVRKKLTLGGSQRGKAGGRSNFLQSDATTFSATDEPSMADDQDVDYLLKDEVNNDVVEANKSVYQREKEQNEDENSVNIPGMNGRSLADIEKAGTSSPIQKKQNINDQQLLSSNSNLILSGAEIENQTMQDPVLDETLRDEELNDETNAPKKGNRRDNKTLSKSKAKILASQSTVGNSARNKHKSTNSPERKRTVSHKSLLSLATKVHHRVREKRWSKY